MRCAFLDGYCIDSINGESTWDRNYPELCNQFNIVYEGIATFVGEKNITQAAHQYVVVEDRSKVFAIQLIQKQVICGISTFQSEHPRLIIVRKHSALEITPFTQKAETRDADLIMYVNTKFLYVEQSFKRSINEMFAQTVHRRCKLHREILKNRLMMATSNPNTVASLVKNKLGYIAKVSGEVIYLMKCLAVPVEVRRDNHCYVELPVSMYNKSLFMSPVTRILQDHGEQIECNSIIPPMYYINNQWIGFDPLPSQGITPQELRADTEDLPKFHTIKDLGAGGLYTYQEINKAQEAMVFNLERNALNNILVRGIAGQEIQKQGFTSLNLFNKEEIEKLANSTIHKLYGYFSLIGEWTSGILGLYFIFRMAKFILETFMNAVAIHKLNGCSLHLLASFWDTLTLFVLHHKQQKVVSEELQRNKETFCKQEDPAEDLQTPEKSVVWIEENETTKTRNKNPIHC